MRTTIDLPDELLRRMKAIAALKGQSLKDFMTYIFEKELSHAVELPSGKIDRGPVPEIIPAAGRKIRMLSHAELFETLDQDEPKRHHRSA